MKKNLKRQARSQEEFLSSELFRDMAISEIEIMARNASLALIKRIMEQEVEELCGKVFSHKGEAKFHRGGTECGSVYLQGQRVPIRRPRVRNSKGEVTLKTYTKLRKIENLNERVLELVSSGVSARKYDEIIEKLAEEAGLSKSSVSRRFIEESRKSMEQFKARTFEGIQFFALIMDGTYVNSQAVVTAMGVDTNGNKHFIGYSIGSSENTEVVRTLLNTFEEKKVSFTENILCVLDGSKSLERAVTDKFGEKVFIQRCKIHKLRNIYSKIPKKYYTEFKNRYNKIFTCNKFEDAKKELESVTKWLSEISYSAKESLEEAGEKLITLQKIGMPGELMRSFNTTNLIESAFSAPKCSLRRVKKWNLESDMLDRWISISLLYQEKRFRKVKGVNSLNLFIHKFTKPNFTVDLKKIA